MRNRTTQDLVQIVANGGGIDIDMRYRTQLDLVQIAQNARGIGRVVMRGQASKTQQELVQIAVNGAGSVSFAD